MTLSVNSPSLWIHAFPWPRPSQHKYLRGHAVVRGGPVLTGAARLCADAAARIGAGLVSLVVDEPAWPVYAATASHIMVRAMTHEHSWLDSISDSRCKVVVIGPGAGRNSQTRQEVLQALACHKPIVLDADALTVFSDNAQLLFQAIQGPAVLTPHEGEFASLFPDYTGSRLERAVQAAQVSRAIVVLKGAETIIAHPDGRRVLNRNAPPELATAGSGDVLSGLIAGLIAQGLDTFNAACAAVWIHARAAALFGPGLVASDLAHQIPSVLALLKESFYLGPTTAWSEADKAAMQEAIQLAKQSAGLNEIPVGAVVIDKGGTLIGRGFNQTIANHDPSAHAEIMALRQAAAVSKNYRLEGARLFVTLEPCPMCLGAIIHARISQLVFGVSDPKTGACGGAHAWFQAIKPSHLSIKGGLYSQECAQVLNEFFSQRRH